MIDSRFALKDTLKCSALALSLFAIAFVLPALGIIVFLTPAFIAVSTYRNSIRMGILGAGVVTVGAVLIFGGSGIFLSAELCGMGLLLGEFMRRKMHPAYVIIFSAILFVSVLNGYIFVSGHAFANGILDNFLNSYKRVLMEEGGSMLETLGGEPYVDETIRYIREIFPAVLIILGILCAYVNYFFAGNMLMKIYLKRQVPMISEFSLPGNVYMGTAIIMGLVLIVKSMGFAYSTSLVLNVTLVFSVLFYLQGFSCIQHFCMTRMKPALRGLIMIFVVLFVPFYTIVEMIGFLDAGFNIRGLKR
ncbi:MAG: DUF2232 domain-containing protein [Filifactoraceae bacterium]